MELPENQMSEYELAKLDYLLLIAKEDGGGIELMGWFFPMNKTERIIIRMRYRQMLSSNRWWKCFGRSEDKAMILQSILRRQGRDGVIKLNRGGK